MLRAAGDAQGAQEGDSPSRGEHVWIHCQGHRAAGCPAHPAQQPEGAGAPDARLHHRGHCHRGGDVRSVHRPSGADERVPHPRPERAKRRPESDVVHVRVHWRDGQGLHLCRRATAGGRAHGPRLGASADGDDDGQAHRSGRLVLGLRGCLGASPQLRVAEHPRGESPRHQRLLRGDRGPHRRPGPGLRDDVCAAGAAAPGKEGARRVLEDLQLPVHLRAGCASGIISHVRRRRDESV
mmetsp:Transcript_18087/g.68582  ORF Transcript_18087/g.68582 Transcript_18087/m.68582 type:complete len:238 (+) Transcript_18087:1830-2543(+)